MIALIAALSTNRVIGTKNQLPWHISEDLKRFRALTSGHPVVMGRKTFESIGKPLPNRANIVITRNVEWTFPGVWTATSIVEALEQARIAAGGDQVFVIGGAEIYLQALPFAQKLYLTEIEAQIEGDAVFPPVSDGDFRKVEDVPGNPELGSPWKYRFCIYERTSARS
jgi:dihydrofolate reductase